MIAQGIRTTYPLTVAQRLDDLIKRVFGAPMGEVFKAPFGGVSAAGVTYLLRDEFTTTESAPLTSPRTCEPGPGEIDITDTGGSGVYIAGNVLTIVPPASWNTTYIETDAFERSIGLACFVKLKIGSDAVLLFDDARITGDNQGIRYRSGYHQARQYPGYKFRLSRGAVSDWRIYAFILNSLTNCMYWLAQDEGSSDWELVLVDDLVYSGNMFFSTNGYSSTGQFDFIKIAQLGSPFDSADALRTWFSATPSAGTVFEHEADFFVDFDMTTLPSSGEVELWFRSPTVGTDGWRITVDSGGVVDLDEVSSGTPVQRATQSVLSANKRRIFARFADDHIYITIYKEPYHYPRGANYLSASSNKTETGGEVESLGTGGAIDDLSLYVGKLSGNALTEVSKYV